MNAKKLTQLAMLTGIALIIFVLELQIPNPFPIPGIKLGLANIITVYAVYHYRPREVMIVVFARIFLAALFSGNMMALAYSFTGSMLCLGGMLPLRKIIDENHLWIASVIGAVLHNIVRSPLQYCSQVPLDSSLICHSSGIWLLCRRLYRRLCSNYHGKSEISFCPKFRSGTNCP